MCIRDRVVTTHFPYRYGMMDFQDIMVKSPPEFRKQLLHTKMSQILRPGGNENRVTHKYALAG